MADWLKRRNWWKIAFFSLLIIFEITRELFVVSSSTRAVPSGFARVFSMDGYTSAEGQWVRIDGEGDLVPSISTIECRRDEGWCVEANTSIHEEYVYAPDLTRTYAKFSDDVVSYKNDFATCVSYTVRIDLRLKKVFAVRERKEPAPNEQCERVEDRIEMQLGNPLNPNLKVVEEKFLPIFDSLRFVLS